MQLWRTWVSSVPDSCALSNKRLLLSRVAWKAGGLLAYSSRPSLAEGPCSRIAIHYCRCLGVLGFTTVVNGAKNSPRLTPSADKMVASASTVTPLSPLFSLPTAKARRLSNKLCYWVQ